MDDLTRLMYLVEVAVQRTYGTDAFEALVAVDPAFRSERIIGAWENDDLAYVLAQWSLLDDFVTCSRAGFRRETLYIGSVWYHVIGRVSYELAGRHATHLLLWTPGDARLWRYAIGDERCICAYDDVRDLLSHFREEIGYESYVWDDSARKLRRDP